MRPGRLRLLAELAFIGAVVSALPAGSAYAQAEYYAGCTREDLINAIEGNFTKEEIRTFCSGEGFVPDGRFDGLYAGEATIDEGSHCIGDGYGVEMMVTGSSFRAVITRLGGSRDGTTFEMEGTVDGEGQFKADKLGGVRATKFEGTISNGTAEGAGGGSGCNWSYTLR
jgi:hypothetical protein